MSARVYFQDMEVFREDGTTKWTVIISLYQSTSAMNIKIEDPKDPFFLLNATIHPEDLSNICEEQSLKIKFENLCDFIRDMISAKNLSPKMKIKLINRESESSLVFEDTYEKGDKEIVVFKLNLVEANEQLKKKHVMTVFGQMQEQFYIMITKYGELLGRHSVGEVSLKAIHTRLKGTMIKVDADIESLKQNLDIKMTKYVATFHEAVQTLVCLTENVSLQSEILRGDSLSQESLIKSFMKDLERLEAENKRNTELSRKAERELAQGRSDEKAARKKFNRKVEHMKKKLDDETKYHTKKQSELMKSIKQSSELLQSKEKEIAAIKRDKTLLAGENNKQKQQLAKMTMQVKTIKGDVMLKDVKIKNLCHELNAREKSSKKQIEHQIQTDKKMKDLTVKNKELQSKVEKHVIEMKALTDENLSLSSEIEELKDKVKELEESLKKRDQESTEEKLAQNNIEEYYACKIDEVMTRQAMAELYCPMRPLGQLFVLPPRPFQQSEHPPLPYDFESEETPTPAGPDGR